MNPTPPNSNNSNQCNWPSYMSQTIESQTTQMLSDLSAIALMGQNEEPKNKNTRRIFSQLDTSTGTPPGSPSKKPRTETHSSSSSSLPDFDLECKENKTVTPNNQDATPPINARHQQPSTRAKSLHRLVVERNFLKATASANPVAAEKIRILSRDIQNS